MKKVLSFIFVILLSGFSFFYAEKVTKIMRKKDPIMIKLNEVKKDSYISVIKPIINNDEYIAGINGCEIDIEKSYNKMKKVREYKKELVVMKETTNNENLSNKYIVGGSKERKSISIIFFLTDNINDKLISYIKNKNIKVNFFVDLKFLENNINLIKLLSENNNIYYLGDNGIYNNEYMLYANNLIEINTKNESKYCFLEKKDDKVLKLCSQYNMKTINSNIIKENILSNIQNNLYNGSIITIDSKETEKIKVSLSYILSKGYNIVTLDELLNAKNNCNN